MFNVSNGTKIEIKIPVNEYPAFKNMVFGKNFISSEPIFTRHRAMAGEFEYCSFESDFYQDVFWVINKLPADASYYQV